MWIPAKSIRLAATTTVKNAEALVSCELTSASNLRCRCRGGQASNLWVTYPIRGFQRHKG